MKIGVIAPQGWTGDYDGWEPRPRVGAHGRPSRGGGPARVRIGLAVRHFHTVPEPTDELTFESFTSLAALAALTERVRLGQIVICNGFRNPALTAKMASTSTRSAAAGSSSASVPAGSATSGSRTATASPTRPIRLASSATRWR